MILIAVNQQSCSYYAYANDVRTGAWWSITFPSTPVSLIPTFPQLQTSARGTGLPINSSGSMYQPDSAEIQGGSNETFDSYVLIPVPLGEPGQEGIFHSITAALAKDSENVDWGIYTGDSAEQAYQKAVADSTHSSPDFAGGQWSYTSSRYLNNTQHPRAGGAFSYIKIWDVAGKRWMLEGVVAEVTRSSRWRVG